MCCSVLQSKLEAEHPRPFIDFEVKHQIFIDQCNGKPAAEEVQYLIVEDPVGNQPERENDECRAEQVMIGLKMMRPRLSRLNVAQEADLENSKQQQGQRQRVEHKQYPRDIVDRLVPRYVLYQISNWVEHKHISMIWMILP